MNRIDFQKEFIILMKLVQISGIQSQTLMIQ